MVTCENKDFYFSKFLKFSDCMCIMSTIVSGLVELCNVITADQFASDQNHK